MKKFAFIISICPLVLITCNQLPEADYYEIDGIISIEAESQGDYNNWIVEHHYTNFGVTSQNTDSDTTTAGKIRYTFYVSIPGEYSIWLLSSRFSNDPNQNFIEVSVWDDENSEIKTSAFQLPARNIPEWVNDSVNDDEVSVRLTQPGFYSIEFNSFGKAGYRLDKLHLSLNNAFKPQGMGFPETTDPRFDPVDQKREQLIRIPPQWAFGGLFGGAVDELTIKNDIEKLLERDIPVDAYWVNNLISDDLSLFMDQHRIRKGTMGSDENTDVDSDFVLLPLESELDVVYDKYEKTRNIEEKTSRGFTFSGINNVYNEEFKLYPVNRYPDYESTGFETLKDQIEKVSNPRLTTYEIPFLTHDLFDLKDVEESKRDELFIRWIQFAAFNPIMTLFPTLDGLITQSGFTLSERGITNLKKYSVLRSRLFPYIYSHAHFTRQSGVKMIKGDGLRNTQFMFGDAFLVAPVSEIGVRERSVYFPDGYWYDYNSNNSYVGGRSWFIRAPLEDIPLFVKAGSIIPYRDYSPTIAEGDKGFLRVEIYTGDAGTFRLTEDDGYSEDYLQGIAARTMFRYNEIQGHKILTIGAVQRHYHEMNVMRDYQIEFLHAERPSQILLNENTIADSEEEGNIYWVYDDDKEAIKLYIPEANRNEKIDIEILP